MRSNTKKVIAAGALLIVAGGCAAAAMHFWPLHQIQERVKASLADPASAQFQGLVKSSKLAGAGCGYVNAKNRMGAYIGFSAFVLGSDGAVTYDTPDPAGGSAAQMLEAAEKRLAFLELAKRTCL